MSTVVVTYGTHTIKAGLPSNFPSDDEPRLVGDRGCHSSGAGRSACRGRGACAMFLILLDNRLPAAFRWCRQQCGMSLGLR